MKSPLHLYDTHQRKVLPFTPLQDPYVGIYWCGPTTYADSHIGHARSAVVLDTLVRTLTYHGYKVRTVRNITDVGHMLGDSDEGEDKVARAARLASVNPMEVVQHYTDRYHAMLRSLGTRLPQIEPRATGHITEQITLVEKILSRGFAYEVNGSVYFDLQAYQKKYGYGELSGRNIDDMITGTRTLSSTSEKKSPYDFALWKKAHKDHLMRWPSPWGEGFPGWHLECTAMSHAYLGFPFDIHGGGLDLCFPHHECEIAQTKAAYDTSPARYWIHHNLVTLAGKKMSKSAQHFITLEQCFHGTHPLLTQSYHPMTVRLLLLQAHYRSPLDLSDDALQAAQKGYYKLINTLKSLSKISLSPPPPEISNRPPTPQDLQITKTCQACHDDLAADLNTPKVLAHLFDLRTHLLKLEKGTITYDHISPATLDLLTTTYTTFVQEILGLQEKPNLDIEAMMSIIIEAYADAKNRKDYEKVDQMRIALRNQGIALHDTPQGFTWQYLP